MAACACTWRSPGPTWCSASCWSAPPAGSTAPTSGRPGAPSDDALATDLEQDGLDAFLTRWLAQPLFASLGDAGIDDRRRNTVAGLASSLRLAGTGTQEPLWARLPALPMPVLLVAGGRDAKFVAAAERMAALVPDATLAIVEGAGHTVHLERPEAFEAVLRGWLRR